MTAAVVSTGEELVTGRCVDSGSVFIARTLLRAGIRVVEVRQVGDSIDDIRLSLEELSPRSRFIVVTGGLGPTEDDRTREALAEWTGQVLVEHPQARAQLDQWFARLGRPISVSNLRQTRMPQGAVLLTNPIGTAPGFSMDHGGTTVFCLPGVPEEMQRMLVDAVVPEVRVRASLPAFSEQHLKVVGLPESVVGERIAHWMQRSPPCVSVTIHGGVVDVCALDVEDPAGERRLRETLSGMREVLGDHVFAAADQGIAAHVVERLKAEKRTVAVAESCTGGAIASALVAIPGASEVFVEGCVVYSEAAKLRIGVDQQLLDRRSPVSEAIALSMADAVRARAGTSHGLASTGFLGPDGGTAECPVGTVFIAVSGPDRRVSRRLFLTGSREGIRERAVVQALDLLRRELPGKSGSVR